MNKRILGERIKSNIEQHIPMTIIETLPVKYFDAGHIPGAVNIPLDDIKGKAPSMLQDKNALIVVYCANTECQNSTQAAQVLQQMGYSNVMEYVEGKQHWTEMQYPVETTR